MISQILKKIIQMKSLFLTLVLICMVFVPKSYSEEANLKINLLKRLIIGLGFAVDKVDQVIKKSFLEISKGSDEEEFIASFR